MLCLGCNPRHSAATHQRLKSSQPYSEDYLLAPIDVASKAVNWPKQP